jgi:hypothetical protein
MKTRVTPVLMVVVAIVGVAGLRMWLAQGIE